MMGTPWEVPDPKKIKENAICLPTSLAESGWVASKPRMEEDGRG
jgi:hypothetical protein